MTRKKSLKKEEEKNEPQRKIQRINTDNLVESNVFYEEVEKDVVVAPKVQVPNLIKEEVEDEGKDLDKTVKIKKKKHRK